MLLVAHAVVLRLVTALRDETKQLPWPPSLSLQDKKTGESGSRDPWGRSWDKWDLTWWSSEQKYAHTRRKRVQLGSYKTNKLFIHSCSDFI